MIGRFLKGLMGGGDGSGAAKVVATEEYNGYELRAMPQNAGNGWRVAGAVVKEIDGEQRTYDFIRADTYPSQDDAATVSLQKARQIVDERGDALFDS